MINFEIPADLQAQQQLIEMVAKQAMRPYSRQLDENDVGRKCFST